MVYRDPGDQDEGDLVSGTRVCKACGLRKPMDEFHWAKRKTCRRRKCKECTENERRTRRSADPAKTARDERRWYLNRRYGLTPDKFNELYQDQRGLCAICQRPLGDSLHVDHDHSCCPGEVNTCGFCIRGLLCMNCNTGLGKFHDSRELLLRAVKYLG